MRSIAPARGRKIRCLFLVFCAMLAGVCAAAGNDVAPPRMHVVRVNEASADALAGVREFAAVQVESCRVTQHLSGSGAPPLTDAQLRKIVFLQDEAFYDGDRIAHYSTRRFVVADGSSSCAPYVLVLRDVSITVGCGTRIVGRSGNDLNSDAPPGPPETHVERTGPSGDACVHARKPVETDGLPTDSAGSDVNCIWQSRLLAARFGALTRRPPAPGNGPSATGLDACLYQPLPHYASAHSAGEDVVLRTHSSAPPAQQAVSGGHIEFEGNTRLQAMDVGGPAAAKFDQAAAEAFVRLPPREGV